MVHDYSVAVLLFNFIFNQLIGLLNDKKQKGETSAVLMGLAFITYIKVFNSDCHQTRYKSLRFVLYCHKHPMRLINTIMSMGGPQQTACLCLENCKFFNCFHVWAVLIAYGIGRLFVRGRLYVWVMCMNGYDCVCSVIAWDWLLRTGPCLIAYHDYPCLSMYEQLWSCMICYGCLWTGVIVYERVWSCMRSYDCVWMILIVYELLNYSWNINIIVRKQTS